MARNTIVAGIREQRRRQSSGASFEPTLRRRGGGRKRLTEQAPVLLTALESLVEPVTRGDPQSPLRWTSKSVRKLADELCTQGHQVSARTVNRLLGALDYSLQANRKTREGSSHPDRDAQFEHINERTKQFQRRVSRSFRSMRRKRNWSAHSRTADGSGCPRVRPSRSMSTISAPKRLAGRALRGVRCDGQPGLGRCRDGS